MQLDTFLSQPSGNIIINWCGLQNPYNRLATYTVSKLKLMEVYIVYPVLLLRKYLTLIVRVFITTHLEHVEKKKNSKSYYTAIVQ
jgi:hypothetical protein